MLGQSGLAVSAVSAVSVAVHLLNRSVARRSFMCPSVLALPLTCSKAVVGGRAAEFRLGATLGALSRTAQGLLESALEGPAK